MSTETNDPLLARVEGGLGRAEEGHGSWPFITKASLVLLGFIPHNPNRKCIRCSEHVSEQLDTLSVVGENATHEDVGNDRTDVLSNHGTINKDGCLVCRSLNPSPKSSDHLPSRMKRYCHVTILAIVTMMLSANLLVHLSTRWGNEKLLLYTVSYTTYFGPFVAVAVYRLAATLMTCRPTSTRAIYTMTDTNVLGLVYRVGVRRYFISGYIYVFIVLSFVIVVTSFHIYHLHNCEHIMPLGVFAFVCELVGVLLFMAFWHVVFVLRTAIQTDLRSTVRFMKIHHSNDSVSRQRIMESYVEFARLDSFVSGWLVFQICIVTFKFFSLVYWDYELYSEKFKYLDEFEQTEARLIDVAMWLEIVILLFLPLISAGSMNLLYIWEKFLALVEYEQNGEYWCCFKMVKHFSKVRDNINITICGCVLSVFVALNLRGQHARYWAGGICFNPYNSTNYTHPLY